VGGLAILEKFDLAEDRSSEGAPDVLMTSGEPPAACQAAARHRRSLDWSTIGEDRQCLRRPDMPRSTPTATKSPASDAVDCGAARHLHRMERLPGTARRVSPTATAADPFARTKEECQAAATARSLEERYGGPRDLYRQSSRPPGRALVAERLLLPADDAAYVETAESPRPALIKSERARARIGGPGETGYSDAATA